MKNLFKSQLTHNPPITEEVLEKLHVKTYKNGDEIKVGDRILFALFIDAFEEQIMTNVNWSNAPMDRKEESNHMEIELITLNEGQFDLYTFDERFQDVIGIESGVSLPMIYPK